MVVVEMWNQTVVWHLRVHRQGDSSNWNCRYYHMEHWVVVACINLRNLHILTSNDSLKGPLDNVLPGGQWIGNWCMDWPVQDS